MCLIFRREDLSLLPVISSVRSGANMPRRMIPVLSNCYCIFVSITICSLSDGSIEKKKPTDMDYKSTCLLTFSTYLQRQKRIMGLRSINPSLTMDSEGNQILQLSPDKVLELKREMCFRDMKSSGKWIFQYRHYPCNKCEWKNCG